MSTLRRWTYGLLHRLAGRNGAGPDRHQVAPAPPSIAVQRAKQRAAEHAARESQRAVDSFTASLDRAMRGHRP